MKKYYPFILLVGIGNELREDDAIGYYLVKNFKLKNLCILYPELYKLNLRKLIKKITISFLDYNFCDYIKDFQFVIFVDSWINNNEKPKVSFSKIENVINDSNLIHISNPFSHYVNIVNFIKYYKALNKINDLSNQDKNKFFLLKIKGYSFGYKKALTKEAKKNMQIASLLLIKFLHFLIKRNFLFLE